MIAILDAAYGETANAAACVLAEAWDAAKSAHEVTWRGPAAAEYEPGAFYKRELPCLLAVLQQAPVTPDLILIDGYVWLGEDAPGLGAHLWRALGERTPVIGIAKTAFAGAESVGVLRGASQSALFITAAGVDALEAAEHMKAMHGQGRIPTLARRADQLARDALAQT